MFRIGTPCFAFLTGIESLSHVRDWPSTLSILPVVSTAMLLGLSWIAWRGIPRLEHVWRWILLPWFVALVGITAHFPNESILSLIFLTMGVLCTGVLILPARSIAVALPITLAAQTLCTIAAFPDRLQPAISIPIFSFVIAILMHLARRTSIVTAERQRLLETSLRRQQEKLDRLEHEHERARFERALDERTRALEASRRVLTEQKKLAEVGVLAAEIAHQINNPLGAIVMSADDALRSQNDPDGRSIGASAIAEIRKQAIRCGQIVRSVLRLSREGSVERWSCDPVQTVRSSIRAISEFGRERGATITLERDPALDGRTCWINPIEIEQVFVNLVRNAIESRDSGVRVRIFAGASDDQAEIAVEDDGPGIPPEDATRVFESFFTTRDTVGGTGLGLALAQEIVLNHAGALVLDLDVDSNFDVDADSEVDAEVEAGRGSTRRSGARFVVRLPLEPKSRV